MNEDLAATVAEALELEHIYERGIMAAILDGDARDDYRARLQDSWKRVRAMVQCEMDARPPVYVYRIAQYGDPLTIERWAVNKYDEQHVFVAHPLSEWWTLGGGE
jgi:hypothetical protein